MATLSRTQSMRPFVFRCPTAGVDVQHWTDREEATSADKYETILCPACAELHFMNFETGRVLGQKKDQ
jgi:hypothetical protein